MKSNIKTVTYAITFPADKDHCDNHCAYYCTLINCFTPPQVVSEESVGETSMIVKITAEEAAFDKYEGMLEEYGARFEVRYEHTAIYSLDMLEALATKWASDRLILQNGTIAGQSKKLGEEFGELMAGLLKGDLAETEDAIGDMIVVLNNIAVMSGSSLTKCLNGAYQEIKDRKGTMMPDGTFEKEKETK